MPLFLLLNYWLILFDSCSFPQIFSPIAELAIPIGISSSEAKADLEIHPVTVEAKTRKC